MYIYIYIYIYMFSHLYIHVHTHTYMYIFVLPQWSHGWKFIKTSHMKNEKAELTGTFTILYYEVMFKVLLLY